MITTQHIRKERFRRIIAQYFYSFYHLFLFPICPIFSVCNTLQGKKYMFKEIALVAVLCKEHLDNEKANSFFSSAFLTELEPGVTLKKKFECTCRENHRFRHLV